MLDMRILVIAAAKNAEGVTNVLTKKSKNWKTNIGSGYGSTANNFSRF